MHFTYNYYVYVMYKFRQIKWFQSENERTHAKNAPEPCAKFTDDDDEAVA